MEILFFPSKPSPDAASILPSSVTSESGRDGRKAALAQTHASLNDDDEEEGLKD